MHLNEINFQRMTHTQLVEWESEALALGKAYRQALLEQWKRQEVSLKKPTFEENLIEGLKQAVEIKEGKRKSARQYSLPKTD